MTDPRATQGPFASWGHRPLTEVDSLRAMRISSARKLRSHGWALPHIASTLGLTDDEAIEAWGVNPNAAGPA